MLSRLGGWSPHHGRPLIEFSDLEGCSQALLAGLQPAGRGERGRVIDSIVAFVGRYSKRDIDVHEVTIDYQDALHDLPLDLLHQVEIRLKRQRKYSNLPTPADLRSLVENDLADRELARRKLDVLRDEYRRRGWGEERTERTEGEKARGAALFRLARSMPDKETSTAEMAKIKTMTKEQAEKYIPPKKDIDSVE